ncbi:cell cycle control protein cwf19 [Magnaporthiopsis poae ATCC 64411]|uniref:Cell cycle control protein cwf19 n=1 Tax=Magnaporthiopsis poae (strain ATCC 64411 / 73-15) TaxID=644358 RepID=A0A0C4DKI9_MAGP6|nr:cell cycle control protein cwf19 [Magnaporthiopsis poae ATCC 64411]
MDGLDEFEKQLAADKAEREREQERADRKEKRRHHEHRRDRSSDRKHDRERRRETDGDCGGDEERSSRRNRDHDHAHDRHRHKHRRHHSRDREDDSHRSKRSRHGREDEAQDEGSSRHRHRHRHASPSRRHRARDGSSGEPEYIKSHDPKEDLPLPDEETASAEASHPVRDSWMTAPSALDVDYMHRQRPDKPIEKPKPEQRTISQRELNGGVLAELNSGKTWEEIDVPTQNKVGYTFGDQGSQWRLTKLKGVYDTAKRTGKSIDEVGAEVFGSLREFDDVREERIEMDRRKTSGKGYVGKEVPTGELYRERKQKEDTDQRRHMSDQDSPPAEQGTVMEQPPAARLDQTALNRMRAAMMKAKLRRAPDAEKLEAEYNAAMASFKSGASSERAVVLDASHSRMLAGGPRAETKAVDTKRGRERGTVVANEDMSVDDMVREERRTRGQAGGEGMRMAERIARDGKFDNDLDYMDENAERLAKRTHKTDAALKAAAVGEFQRNAAAPRRRMHAAMVAVPIPYDQGDTAPAFFREAMLSTEEEWSQHKKYIDTGKKAREGLGRAAFRKSIAKEAPYFHVWFNLDGGLGHVVEDETRWPRGDLFAREIIGGMLDSDVDVIKKQGRWTKQDNRVDDFKKRWRKFDWTRVLAEGQ